MASSIVVLWYFSMVVSFDGAPVVGLLPIPDGAPPGPPPGGQLKGTLGMDSVFTRVLHFSRSRSRSL